MTYRKQNKYSFRPPTASRSSQMARRALAIARFTHNVLNVEVKKHDFSGTTTVDWGGYTGVLTAIAEGDTVNQRSGYSIKAKYLQIKVNALLNASASQTNICVLVVQDLNSTTTNPVVSDVLQVTSQTYAPLSNISIANAPRFKILARKYLNINDTGNSQKACEIYLNFNKFRYKKTNHIKYTGSASTDEGKNQIYLMMVSNEQTNTPTVQIYARLGYYDN